MEKPTTNNTLPSKAFVEILWRNIQLYRQAKTKRIQHHQTSFIIDAKRTSLGGKEKAKTRNKKITKWESSQTRHTYNKGRKYFSHI